MLKSKMLKFRKTQVRLIAVHCSHGVNRTGWYICRYLMNVMKLSVEKAIEEFERARGHSIEHDTLIKNLCSL